MLGAQQSGCHQTLSAGQAQHLCPNGQRLHVVIELLFKERWKERRQLYYILYQETEPPRHTSLTCVVHEKNFSQQFARRSIDDTPNGAQQNRPGFVVEDNDHGRCGQLGAVLLVNATIFK